MGVSLEDYGKLFRGNTELIAEQKAEIERLRQQNVELSEALHDIADGHIPIKIGETYRSDGKPSKNDKCVHGRYVYDDCGNCYSDYASDILTKATGRE